MTNKLIKAIIFDMDGLVLDTETTYQLAWQQAAMTLGYRLHPSFLASLSGLSADNVQQQLMQHLGYDFPVLSFLELSCFYWQEQVKDQAIPIKPGFHELLSTLSHLDLNYCLATNSRLQDARNCLALAGLTDVFPLIISKDDVAQSKPAPDIFFTAAARLGFAVNECLVLEDSAIGIAAAVAAGSPCIYVPSIYPVDQWASQQANAVLVDLHQVKTFLHTLPKPAAN